MRGTSSLQTKRWSRRSTLGFAAAATLAPAAFIEPAHAQGDGWTPYEYNSGIRLNGVLNGREVRIVLDSGSSGIVLDRAAAEPLGVAVTDRSTNAVGLGARVDVPLSGPFELVIPGERLNVRYNVGAAALGDFSAMAQAGEPFDLLLGRPAFESFFVDIDFEHQRLAFRRSLDASTRRGPHLPLRPTERTLRALDVSIGEGAPFQAVFDLGSSSTLSISQAYAEQHNMLAGLRRSRWIAAGIEGVTEYDVATLPRVRIGALELTDTPVDVQQSWLSDVPGNLGYGTLSQFGRIITDYRHDRLYVIAREGPQRPFRKNRSGIAAVREGERARVIFVAPSSPGERAGWHAGDQFVAMDGVPVAQSYDRMWGGGPPGTVIAFTMADGSARNLTLADYY